MSDQISLQNIKDKDFALAEYSALREEILKRIEFQNQILNLTLITAGTAVSVGLQLTNGHIILLVYPPIALVLSAGWEQNNLRIRQIGIYIRERIEERFGGGWEQYRIHPGVTPTGTARFARFAFIITQIVTILLSWRQFSWVLSWRQLSSWRALPWTLIILSVLDLIVVVGTALIIKTIPLKEAGSPMKRLRKLREWIARIFSSR